MTRTQILNYIQNRSKWQLGLIDVEPENPLLMNDEAAMDEAWKECSHELFMADMEAQADLDDWNAIYESAVKM